MHQRVRAKYTWDKIFEQHIIPLIEQKSSSSALRQGLERDFSDSLVAVSQSTLESLQAENEMARTYLKGEFEGKDIIEENLIKSAIKH